LPTSEIRIVRTLLYLYLQEGRARQVPPEHIEEELEAAEGENQIDHEEDASDSFCGADRKIELVDVGMG
jgi:hypothetical protein